MVLTRCSQTFTRVNDGRDAAVVSTTAPSDKSQLWLDTSATPNLFKRWNGTDWVVVHDFDVGTRNLLRNSLVQLEKSGEYVDTFFDIAVPLKENQTYTLVINGAVNQYGDFYAQFTSGSSVFFSEISKGIEMKNYLITLQTSSAASGPLQISNHTQGDVVSPYIKLNWAALYEGAIRPPVDWTPAPEDLETELDNKTEEIRKEITNLSSVIDQTTSEINQKVQATTTQTMENSGQVRVLRDSLSTISQKMDSVTTSISSMGGNNLLRGSAANSLDSWSVSSVSSVSLDRASADLNDTETGGAFRIVSGALSQKFSTVTGKTYAFRFLYKLSGSSASVTFGGTPIPLASSSDWNTATGSFTAQSFSTTVVFQASNSTLRVADPIVVRGELCNAWEQASGEIDTAEMQVDRGGIHMKKEGETLQTQITYREFRVVNSTSGKTIAYFSDAGAEFSESKVNKALKVASESGSKDFVIMPQGNGHVFLVVND